MRAKTEIIADALKMLDTIERNGGSKANGGVLVPYGSMMLEVLIDIRDQLKIHNDNAGEIAIRLEELRDRA